MAQYTTAEMVEAEIRADESFSTSTLPTLSQVTTWIEQESAQVERDAGMSFSQTNDTIYWDYSGEEELTLPNAPIISVDTLWYNKNPLGSESGEDWETKTEDTHYTVYKNEGVIALLLNRFIPSFGRKRIRIAYTYGYTTTPALVEKLTTKQVAYRVLESLIHNNVNESNDGGSISVGSISIVEPAGISVNTMKSLSTSIESLKQDISKSFGVYRYGSYYNGESDYY